MVPPLTRKPCIFDPRILSDTTCNFADVIARQIIKAVLTADDDNDVARGMNLTQELSTRLQQVCDISKALEVLLVSLELDRGMTCMLYAVYVLLWQ